MKASSIIISLIIYLITIFLMSNGYENVVAGLIVGLLAQIIMNQ